MKKYVHLFLAALLVSLLPLPIFAQTIISVAGIGAEGWTGDGGDALAASMNWPSSVAVDHSGNIYIADADNNVIRKITGGIITTVAGNGFREGTGYGAFNGDGGPATAANLFFPTGVAVDISGDIFIADNGNNCIRKVNAAGNISTIAGLGGAGSAGFSGDGGAATAAAQLHSPTRVALDSVGNIYIADAGNSCIRKVVVSTGFISTIAGTSLTGYGGDGGPANAAQLNMANDVAVDHIGNVIIADMYNNRIRAVDTFGNISTIGGTGISGFSGDGGPATAADLFQPSGIALDDSGDIYFSDLGNSRVRKISYTGIITTIAGNDTAGYNGDNKPATAAELWFPEGLAVKNNKNVYIADRGNFRIRMISPSLSVHNVTASGVDIAVFPNPNQGAFTISITTGFDEQAQIVITNIAGEKLTEMIMRTNTPQEIKFDAPPGMYFLSAVTAHGVVNEKLTVK